MPFSPSPLRILALADHRLRDVPSLALLRRALEARLPEAEVRVISFDLWQAAVEYLKPHVVILNHLHGRRSRTIADTVRRRGGLVVILPTEGRPNSEAQIVWAATDWPANLCDLYLAWSPAFADRLSPIVRRVAAGGIRFDFYLDPALRALLPDRVTVCGLYDLDPARPVVTVASSFPNAKFAQAGQSFHVSDWQDLGVTSLPGRDDPIRFAQDERTALGTFQSWLTALAQSCPEVQLLVKPHPAEDVRPWQRFAAETGAALMLSDYAWSLLAAADCHVARADCLTGPEAWFLDRPTVFALLDPVNRTGPGWEATYHAWVASSAESLDDTVNRILDRDGARLLEFAGTREYLARWLTPGPDATGRAAEAIAALVRERTPKTVADPGLDDRLRLHAALVQHDRAHAVPRADAIGQFGKAVRQTDVDAWLRRLEVA